MTDEQVRRFVRGYMPAYELFLERLQNGNFFEDTEKKHVQVVLNRDRDVVEVKDCNDGQYRHWPWPWCKELD